MIEKTPNGNNANVKPPNIVNEIAIPSRPLRFIPNEYITPMIPINICMIEDFNSLYRTLS